MRISGALAIAIAGLVLSTRAPAQVVLPPSTDPGRIQERVAPPPSSAPALELPAYKGSARELPESALSVRVTLTAIRIEGATALPAALLQARADEYVGREISGADIFGLARTLTAMYRERGFLLSQVIVPPQSLSEGRLTLRAVEGYVANVNVEGDPAARETLVRIGAKIAASRPLNSLDLERYLLLANDLPGMQLRSVLAPSQVPGAADLTLIASTGRADGFASLDNYGSRYLGPGQVTAGVTANQLFGVNDQLRFIGVSTGTSEMAFGQLSYSQVLGAEGLRAGMAFSQARSRPGDVLKPFDVRGRAQTASLSASYPFLRTRNESLSGRAVYDHRDVDTDILGKRVVEDRIRALRLGLTWTVLDRLDGHNTLDIELSEGLGGTAAGDPLKSRAAADGRFRKVSFDYERFQRIGANFGLTLGVGGQWTDAPLLSSEQFALGGRRFGRAYEPAELVGDRALAFRVEPVYFGAGNAAWLRSYQVYGFYDIGKVWQDSAALAGPAANQSLASAGFGARVALDRNVSASLEAAVPLTKPIASYQAGGNGKDARLLGSMLVRF